ncbi:MAG TPA: hypothetical protein VIF09_09585 [Polyangiaceae bacterium]|jgi:formylmethanofuran dehydrogenase subunit C
MKAIAAVLLAGAFLLACQASITAGGGASGSVGDPAGDSVVEPGPTPSLTDNMHMLTLRPGVYHGDLVVSGNANTVQGAGPAATTIDGAVRVSGNSNRVLGVRVLGETQVSGNLNRLEGNEYVGGIHVSGNGNTP